MKKLALIFISILLTACSFLPDTSTGSTGLQVDPICSAYLLTLPTGSTGNPPCNLRCDASCIQQGKSCSFGAPTSCIDPVKSSIPENVTYFFGLNFGPPEEAPKRLIRWSLTLAFSGLALGAIIYGLYGLYVRTTAIDNADKLELSTKIFKNAILGIIIGFMGVVIIQIVALITGLTTNILDFDPQYRRTSIQVSAGCANVGNFCSNLCSVRNIAFVTGQYTDPITGQTLTVNCSCTRGAVCVSVQ